MQTLYTLLLLINDPNGTGAESTAAVAPENFWTPPVMMFCAIGLSILIIWLFRYEGIYALRRAPIRRNRLFGFEAIVLLGVWLLSMIGLALVIEALFANRSQLFRESMNYPLNAFLDIILIAAMAWWAHCTFARRLKGFGLRFRTIGKDAVFAFVNLMAVYPLILLSLWAVLTVGRFINKDFGIQVHQSLTFLGENANPAVTIMVVFTILVIVPIFEEMLFRGFLQTTLRSVTGSPWAAILFTSFLFSLLHPVTHIPALFFLACGLGYAYERSGSLLRSMFMHMFFNGISVVGMFLAR